jgi:hypothetical protein
MQFLGKEPQALTDVLMPDSAARLHEDYLVDAAAASIVGNFILGLQAVVLNRLATGATHTFGMGGTGLPRHPRRLPA